MNWFDIIKIAPHERAIAESSDVWSKEAIEIQNQLKTIYGDLEWKEHGENSDIMIGFLTDERDIWIKIVYFNRATLSTEFLVKVEHIPRIKYAMKQFNELGFEGWPVDIEDADYSNIQLNDFSSDVLQFSVNWTKSRVNYFITFWNKLLEFEESEHADIRFKTSKIGDVYSYEYFFPDLLSQNSFKYSGQTLNQMIKDYNSQIQAQNRASQMTEGIIESNTSVRNMPPEEMKETIDELMLIRHSDINEWVEVIGNTGMKYYIHKTEPKGTEGRICSIDMFDSGGHWYCTSTDEKFGLPFGDFIAGLILMTINDDSSKFKESIIRQ